MTSLLPPAGGAEDLDALFPPPLIDILSDLTCVVFRREMRPDGQIRYVWFSHNVLDIFGFRPDEMTVTGTGALNALHWADRDTHTAAIRRSAASMTRCQETFRAVTSGGETHWFRGSSVPRALADGTIVWDGAWADISPWMRAEHQFQTVMDHAEDVILTLDARNGIDWANAATERLFGYRLDEILGYCLSHLLAHPCHSGGGHLADCPPGELMQCFPHGNLEMQARRKDGSTFPFEMTVSEVRSDGRLSLIVIGRDITRRRKTEQMLEETERRLRTIAANLPGVVFQRVLDEEGSFSYPYVSQGIEEILGCMPQDIVEDCSLLFDAMPDGDREHLLRALLDSADTLEPVSEVFRVHGRGGRIRWLRGQSRPRRRSETAIAWEGVILDVTDEVEERMRAEAAMRESEERFRQAFAAASLGIVVVGLDGTIQQSNPAFRAMCGGQAVDGSDFFRFVDRDLLPVTNFQEDSTVQEGSGETASFCLDHAPSLADGGEHHWRVTGTRFAAFPGAPSASLLFHIQDITDTTLAAMERRQLELALQEGHKLEALGRLAGGVAHELNNMLGPILMGAEMLTRTASLDDRNQERCGRIIEAAKHGRDIVRNVLAYCRKEQKIVTPFDLAPLFHQFAGLAASVLPPTVKVLAHCELDRAVILGEASQIQQILLNLANNGSDAMDGRGTLGLTLKLLPALEIMPQRSLRERTPDNHANPFAVLDPTRDHVEIRVSDSGCGMRPETAAKIFDPFFTTKPVGQGTGLGLSVVRGIVKAMNGAIAVESVLSTGTTFRIALPIQPDEVP
jgi:PAS domain S-box-containing protein